MSQQNTYEGSHDDESNENESNDDESSYDYDEFSEEEENHLPQWNIPNWRGNSPECLCIKQVVEDGSIRGCAECDDYWDMPSLVGDAEEIQSR
jgi:hypothetical protein